MKNPFVILLGIAVFFGIAIGAIAILLFARETEETISFVEDDSLPTPSSRSSSEEVEVVSEIDEVEEVSIAPAPSGGGDFAAIQEAIQSNPELRELMQKMEAGDGDPDPEDIQRFQELLQEAMSELGIDFGSIQDGSGGFGAQPTMGIIASIDDSSITLAPSDEGIAGAQINISDDTFFQIISTLNVDELSVGDLVSALARRAADGKNVAETIMLLPEEARQGFGLGGGAGGGMFGAQAGVTSVQGEISAIEDDLISIDTNQGTLRISVSDDTVVTTPPDQGSRTDLAEGMAVIAMGAPTQGGAIEASSIVAGPEEMLDVSEGQRSGFGGRDRPRGEGRDGSRNQAPSSRSSSEEVDVVSEIDEVEEISIAPAPSGGANLAAIREAIQSNPELRELMQKMEAGDGDPDPEDIQRFQELLQEMMEELVSASNPELRELMQKMEAGDGDPDPEDIQRFQELLQEMMEGLVIAFGSIQGGGFGAQPTMGIIASIDDTSITLAPSDEGVAGAQINISDDTFFQIISTLNIDELSVGDLVSALARRADDGKNVAERIMLLPEEARQRFGLGGGAGGGMFGTQSDFTSVQGEISAVEGDLISIDTNQGTLRISVSDDTVVTTPPEQGSRTDLAEGMAVIAMGAPTQGGAIEASSIVAGPEEMLDVSEGQRSGFGGRDRPRGEGRDGNRNQE